MSAYWFKMRYQIYVDKCRRWKHIITTQLISVVTFYHKYLWYRKHDLEEDEREILTQMLPKAIINQGSFDIASPNKAFWDIKCKRSDIFQEQERRHNVSPSHYQGITPYLGFD